MIVSKKYQILYYDVPKTGSISFDEYFKKYYEGRYVLSGRLNDYSDDMTIEQKLHRLKHARVPPEGTEGYVKVATVRNPFDRACSMYFFYRKFRELIINLDDQNALKGIYDTDVTSFDNFLDYCIEVTENSDFDDTDFSRHCCFPCHKYMGHEQSYDFIRIEHVKEDLKKFSFYNPEHILEHHNKTDSYPRWKDLQTEERRRKIVRWAEKDFEKFSYNA